MKEDLKRLTDEVVEAMGYMSSERKVVVRLALENSYLLGRLSELDGFPLSANQPIPFKLTPKAVAELELEGDPNEAGEAAFDRAVAAAPKPVTVAEGID